jgi:hypothetical protein
MRMQTICRLIQLAPDDAAGLAADVGTLSERVRSATIYGDVYRYWHAIEFLLAQHRPGSAAAKWLAAGLPVSSAVGDIPGARLLSPTQVQDIDADLRGIEPEDLFPYYDAAALDAAHIYPMTWQTWEQDFDPLGQVLEHYSFLQEHVSQAAQAGAALLLYFDLLAEGSV